MNPIRLLHTESSLAFGGQERRILTEMEHLSEFGYTSVLAAQPKSRILAQARQRGLAAEAVSFRSSLDPLAIWRMGRLLRSHEIDLVNAHGSKDAWSSAIAARLLGRKIVRARHVGNPIRRGKLSQLIYGPLCDRIVVTSQAIARGMTDRGVDPRRMDCVPTGIAVDKFSGAVHHGALRRELGIPRDAPIVGMVSVLRGNKGPQIFVTAAHRLLQQGSPAWFVLVGDGPRRGELEGLARESDAPQRVRLTGHRGDIPEILKEFTLAVVPSTSTDGIPQAILQAFAAGVPVVASDVGGVNEVARHGETAWCVAPKNAADLAAGIAHLLADKPLRDELTARAFALVSGSFSERQMLERMDEIYRALLGGR